MRYEQSTVDITLGDQKFDAPYEKKTYESFEDILREAQGDDKTTAEKAQGNILKKLNAAEDTDRRLAARQEALKDGDIARAASVEAQVKAFMKSRSKHHKPVTEEEARKRVLAMMED